MSLRYEQYAALKKSEGLLKDLLDPSVTPRIPKRIRGLARHALRHFPPLTQIGQPIFSQDTLTKDEI